MRKFRVVIRDNSSFRMRRNRAIYFLEDEDVVELGRVVYPNFDTIIYVTGAPSYNPKHYIPLKQRNPK